MDGWMDVIVNCVVVYGSAAAWTDTALVAGNLTSLLN